MVSSMTNKAARVVRIVVDKEIHTWYAPRTLLRKSGG